MPHRLSATIDGHADFLTSFEYDAENRLTAVCQTGQGGSTVADKLITFTYTESGALDTVTRYASTDEQEMVAVSQYGYDQSGSTLRDDSEIASAYSLAPAGRVR